MNWSSDESVEHPSGATYGDRKAGADKVVRYAILIVFSLINIITLSQAFAFQLFAPGTGDPGGGGKVIYSRSTWNINNQSTPNPFTLSDGSTLSITANGTAMNIAFPGRNASNPETYTASDVAQVINNAFNSNAPPINAIASAVDTDYGVGLVRITAATSVFVTGGGGSANADLQFRNENDAQNPWVYTVISPTDPPPFYHWDLRRFTDNKVPYSVNPAGITNFADTQTAVAQVETAFDSWELVSPSIIRFETKPDTTTEGIDPGGAIQKDNANVIDWQTTAQAPYVAGGSAITGVWIDVANNSGRIVESDIVFNNDFKWTDTGMNWVTDSLYDIQGIAAHEIGHFIGLGHVKDSDQTATAATMSYDLKIWETGTELRSLAADDASGANFLYTPDHGDAPDPYPVKVHGSASADRLNGVQLLNPGPGATHIFGYRNGFKFEWLGADVDHAADEWDAKQTDQDAFDDGVKITGTVAGDSTALQVTVNVSTEDTGNHVGPRYLNAWFDWNSDGVWDENEHVIGKAAAAEAFLGSGSGPKLETRIYNLQPVVPRPYGVSRPIWARFRLDYKEDVGQVDKTDETLSLATGAAQFGEVEDYNLYGSYHQWNVTVTSDSGGQPGGTPPDIESSKDGSTEANAFTKGEPVYGFGDGYSADTTYTIHVVADRNWSNGDTIPARISGTAAEIHSDATGKVSSVIWSGCEPGRYDIVVDVNSNGKYDAGIDALDDFDVGSAGFTQVPSIALWGALLFLLTGLAGLRRAGLRGSNDPPAPLNL